MQYYFITGTSRGIGKALCQRILAEPHVKVVGLGRKNTIIHPNYTHITLDLGDVMATEKVLPTLFKRLITPEKVVLINNAGMLGDIGHVGNIGTAHLPKVITLNTVAPMLLTNAFIRAYASLECPKTVINISSGAGKNPLDGWAAYCTSKAALDMFTRVVAVEQDLLPHGVKMYSIAPGVVDTAMQAEIRTAKKEDFSMIDRFIDYKETDQLSNPKDIAEKYWHFLQHQDEYKEVLLDVRHF